MFLLLLNWLTITGMIFTQAFAEYSLVGAVKVVECHLASAMKEAM